MTVKSKNWSMYILLLYIIYFIISAIVSFIQNELIAVDKTIAALLIFGLLLITIKYQINPIIAVLTGLIFFPHEIGGWGFYSIPLWNYHFDLIVHFSTAFITAILVTYFSLKHVSKSIILAFILGVCITVSFGAVIEIMEYWGFLFIGFGSGYLGFGIGDDSSNYGPWENSSLDTSFNLIGAILGSILTIIVYKWYLNRKNDQRSNREGRR